MTMYIELVDLLNSKANIELKADTSISDRLWRTFSDSGLEVSIRVRTDRFHAYPDIVFHEYDCMEGMWYTILIRHNKDYEVFALSEDFLQREAVRKPVDEFLDNIVERIILHRMME